MISIICVFNDQDVLERRLLKGLSNQSVSYDLVLIDNTRYQFDRASSALNHGASLASGDWVLFAHQDIELLSESWLERAESILNSSLPEGWVGVAGVTESGVSRGFLIDRDCLLGRPSEGLATVQTMDECVLIHRRLADGNDYFDTNLGGWHAYGVEACVKEVALGRDNYVLGLPTWHDSKSLNTAGLEASHRYVWQKYSSAVPQIATTCGLLPDDYAWTKHKRKLPEPVDRISFKLLTEAGFSVKSYPSLGEIAEQFTVRYDEVHVLHAGCGAPPVETRAFVPTTSRPRRVVHHFDGLEFAGLDLANVVVMPEVAGRLLRKGSLSKAFSEQPFVLLCVRLKDIWWHPSLVNVLHWTRISGVANIPYRPYDDHARHVFVTPLPRTN